MKKMFANIMKLLTSVVLLIIFVNKIDISQLKDVILTINFQTILLLLFISFMQIAIISFTQINFLGNIGLELNFKSIFKENLIAALFGFIAPGMIGTDTYYTYSYGKKISNYSKAFSGILFLRILGFSIAILFVIFSFIYVGSNLTSKYKLFEYLDLSKIIIVVIGVIAVTVIMFFLFKKSIFKYYNKMKNDFIDLLKITLKRKKLLLIVIFLLISFYVFSVGSRLLLSSIIGINMPVIKLGAVILIINFILLIPVSISGIGVREGGFIGLLSLYNIPSEKAFLLSMFDFSITVIAALLGGIILLYRIIKRRRNVKE